MDLSALDTDTYLHMPKEAPWSAPFHLIAHAFDLTTVNHHRFPIYRAFRATNDSSTRRVP